MVSTKRKCWSGRVCLLLLAFAGGAVAWAEETPPTKGYAFEMRLYQVLTNITGNGLTSQTLPATLSFRFIGNVHFDSINTKTGELALNADKMTINAQDLNAWLQIVHERLDNVELAMERATLTWNGQPEPDHPRIMAISKPSIMTPEGKSASVNIALCAATSLQYMVKRQDDLFELKTWERGKDTPDPGVTISLTPRRNQSAQDLVDVDFSFAYTWVGAREEVEGVNLPIGKPRLMHVRGDGPIQIRLGEWSCYRTRAESQGWFYLFIRATDPAAKTEAPANTTK